MSSILTTISGQFSKSLILGAFAPVAAFVILFLIFVLPLLPANLPLLQPLEAFDISGKVITISVVVIVLSLLLYNLNIPIIRWYEGYPWMNSRIGKWRSRYHRQQLYVLRIRFDGMRALRDAMDALRRAGREGMIRAAVRTWEQIAAANDILKRVPTYFLTLPPPAPAPNDHSNNIPLELRARWDAMRDAVVDQASMLGICINNEFRGDSFVLPTRLGNVIASFENYPKREYGMDAVILWPRLIAQIPSEFAASIDDAKTAFDFMLNGSVLSLLLAVAVTLAGLFYSPATSLGAFLFWILPIVGFTVLSWALYQLSVSRARAWGDMVKSAFDLYRSHLLTQLGYKRESLTHADEKELWDRVSRRIVYGNLMRGATPEYALVPATSPPFAKGTPESASLEVTRGAWPLPWANAVNIVLTVRNPDPAQTVRDIAVTDKVEDNFLYEWDSAVVEYKKVRVVGTNPYEFHIGDIEPQGLRVLTYIVISRILDKEGGAK